MKGASRVTGSKTASLALYGATLLGAGLLLSGCPDDPKPPPECTTNADCGADKACEGGKCVLKPPPPPECQSDNDCEEGKGCQGGKCVQLVAKKAECITDADCRPGFACEDEKCVARPECSLDAVYFDFDAFSIRSDMRRLLQQNYDCLKSRPDYRIRIEGHCDERGTEEYNLALGENRARAVRDFLRDMGIDSSRMEIISYGEARPADPGHGDSAWSRNRRGELVKQ